MNTTKLFGYRLLEGKLCSMKSLSDSALSAKVGGKAPPRKPELSQASLFGFQVTAQKLTAEKALSDSSLSAKIGAGDKGVG